ncbi:MAG: ribose 5-phosphate isomerase A [Solirubrobacteraceae bacterium]
MTGSEAEKQAAARAAAALVSDGQLVGLGSGSTVAYLFPALAQRGVRVRCVATSPSSERAARAVGLEVEPFEHVRRLDIAIDGADQITAEGWLIKGGGAAHTREKIVAAATDRFIVIAGHEKLVDALRPPVPLELLEFGLDATLEALAPTTLRDVPRSPDGGLIADYHGPIDDPAELAARLSATPGLVDHGLFAPALTSEVLIARGEEILTLRISG